MESQIVEKPRSSLSNAKERAHIYYVFTRVNHCPCFIMCINSRNLPTTLRNSYDYHLRLTNEQDRGRDRPSDVEGDMSVVATGTG